MQTQQYKIGQTVNNATGWPMTVEQVHESPRFIRLHLQREMTIAGGHVHREIRIMKKSQVSNQIAKAA